jgi:hypothetical protein
VDEYRPGRPEPDWREVHRELKRGRHVTQQLLWLEYKERHPDGWGYTQFCVHFRRWLERQDVVMRLEHRAGERMFIEGWFEVIAGKSVPTEGPARCFGFVQTYDPKPKRRLFETLKSLTWLRSYAGGVWPWAGPWSRWRSRPRSRWACSR